MNASEGRTPRSELQKRIAGLQRELVGKHLDGALILQNTDLFYFAGTIQQGHLYIPAEGKPLLMVHKILDRARAESGLEHIIGLDSPGQIPALLEQNGYQVPRSIGLECDVLPVNRYFAYQKIFNRAELSDISHVIRLIRAVKSAYEIDLIARAAQLSDRVAGCVKELLHEGMTEIELAGKIEAEARKLGHQGIVRMRMWGGEMFYGHLMAGSAAAVPSYLSSPTGGSGLSPAVAQGPGMRPIRRNEPVLVDYVFAFQGYNSDHTRIFSLGRLSDDLIQAHAAMLEVQSLVKQAARPGVSAGEIYELATDRAAALGYADHFMGAGSRRIRFVGHGVGLELDEYPFLAQGQEIKLKAGMVVALEPKLIFPGKGVVGIENTHVVTEKGLKQLTRFPEEITVV